METTEPSTCVVETKQYTELVTGHEFIERIIVHGMAPPEFKRFAVAVTVQIKDPVHGQVTLRKLAGFHADTVGEAGNMIGLVVAGIANDMKREFQQQKQKVVVAPAGSIERLPPGMNSHNGRNRS